jgi:DNA-binding transcriptional ArsR family regulator
MISIDVDVTALARTRIATSAVWEVTAAVTVLFRPQPPVLHGRLHAELRDLVRERTPERVGFDVRLLADVARAPGGRVPRALTPAPTTGHLSPSDQLGLVAGTDPEATAEDLAALRSAYPGRYDGWSPAEYAERLAAALTGFWDALLEPVWDRVAAIQDADVAHHVNVLAAEGLAATLLGMHPDLDLDGEVLGIRGQGPRQAPTARHRGLWFVPCVFRWPDVLVGHDLPEGACVGYGARGAGMLWDDGVPPSPSLASLVGRSRAAILGELDVPRTTTLLAGRVELSAPTVSAHLSVLVGAGLLTSQRTGRRVLYRRTPLGDRLVACSAGTMSGELHG